MPNKGKGATSLREIDRFGRDGSAESALGGVGWIAHPEEAMQRASHGFAHEGEVWIVDPVDAERLDDLLADLGDVAGVLVLLDRHKRDAAAVANRHDVAVHIPVWMTGVASTLDAPVERLQPDEAVGGFQLYEVLDVPFWQEAALHRPADDTLYVPEALGTTGLFRAGDERVGVHPVLRLTPPSSLTELPVERLFVGHGTGITEDAEDAISTAVRTARRRAPRAWLEGLRALVAR